MLSVRPKVAELAFHLFGRSLHPELFEVHKSRTVDAATTRAHRNYQRGHVVTWRYRGLTLTEVCNSAQHPLPEKRRLLSYRLKGERNDKVECRGGITYKVNFSLEPVTPEIFWAFQDEINRDGEKEGLMQNFDSSGRMSVGAISYINVKMRTRSLLVQAFHTFPDDYAIVKSQSLFELP